MAIDTTGRSSRRALLAACLGAGAAAFAQALARPLAVRAANGDPVIAGEENQASATTTLTNPTTNETVLTVTNGEAGSTGIIAGGDLRGVFATGQLGLVADGGLEGVRATGGIYGVTGNASGNGHAGIFGWSDSGYGVRGQSDTDVGILGESQSKEGMVGSSKTATGVVGVSTDSVGIHGTTGSQTAPGVFGWALGTGVCGASGGALTPPDSLPIKTGVYGYAAQDGSANGVYGRSTVGTGVYAQAENGGTALKVSGKASFSRSGTLSLASGKSSIAMGVSGLTSGSLVFAVVRSGDGGVWVRKVLPASGKFTIYMNRAVSSPTKVNWIAFG